MPEIELKFQIAKANLSKVRTLPALRESIKGARTQQTKTVYFDTVDQYLWRRGFSLRVRGVDGHLIQTVKQEGSSLIERGEWEREILPRSDGAPAHPDPLMIEGTPLAEAIDESVRTSLSPAFEIDVERTVFPWVIGETLIEVAIDRGAIRVIARRRQALQISELELELKQGDRRIAFAAARTLAAQAPLSLSLISKAERGHRLLTHAIAEPVKPSTPRLSGDMTIGAAFGATCRACLHDFMLNATALEGGDPVEAVHQGRVALRRLRAALVLFKPLALDGRFAHINGELKWLASILGAARDGDILGVSDSAGASPSQGEADFQSWREARRLVAHEAVRAAVGSKRWRIFVIDLCEWIEDGERPRRPLDDRRDAVVRFVRKQLRRRRATLLVPTHGLAELDPDSRHKLRIKAKKLRYMAQFFAGFAELADAKQLSRLLVCLDKLQSALGNLRDEEARRGVEEAEIELWRGEAGNADAALLAAAKRLAGAVHDGGKNLGKAMKAYAALVNINPF